MKFPEVAGANLAGNRYNLPADFEGEVNLVLIPFQREQQDDVDTWAAFVGRLVESYGPFLHYYELPTISQRYGIFAGFIDGGMRAGIPDPVARATTLTLYLDKRAFRRALELPNEQTIYALLVDRRGQVLWRADGKFTTTKGAEVEQIVRHLYGTQ